MVIASISVYFLPKFAAMPPTVVVLSVQNPTLSHDVCLVTIRGPWWSAPMAALVSACIPIRGRKFTSHAMINNQ